MSAPSSLREIGAPRTADIVEQANLLFGSGGPNENRKKRQAQLKLFPESHLDRLDELDRFIFDDPEDLEELLSNLAEKNGLKA